MEIKADSRILKVFFEEPRKAYLIREVARKTGVNHTTVSQYLKNLVKEGILVKEKDGLYGGYRAVLSKKYLNLKLFYNFEKLRKSKLIEELQKFYDFPTIVVFGSYAKAMDDSDSDIDICVLTEIDKEFETGKYEKLLNRKIGLHRFNRKKWNIMKEKNKELVNNICNGITLSGELEVM
ncbi:MAG: winged helix-turn-helix domain-containing protein [Nanoarchaeota archaeon]|nr:winged helix-turn-helix domain-containing protein [Nanoarchaeota archaeon]